ncbi:MAG: hypothetical protein KGR26_04335 [Cyanobacteria bacterium REEB65]|nr:hypothetical protein [Cyanobacteria bacterium REEB65]
MPAKRHASTVGAFYTSTDVAAYLAQATIVPLALDWLFGRSGDCQQALALRIREDPRRYVRSAMLQPELPAETPRQATARHDRTARLMERLQAGRVKTTVDFIRHNLDLLRIAADAAETLASPTAAQAYLDRLGNLTVLDPTCGEGSFLLAAFDVLLALQAGPGRQLGASEPDLARHIADQLFGVDLVEAAAARCQTALQERACASGAAVGALRNIRVGNAVCGFAWENEFPGVAARDGFQVVVGNPPYVPRGRLDYVPQGAHPYPDLYGYLVEACLSLAAFTASIGLVLPLSIAFSRDFAGLREQLAAFGDSWYASFDNIPAPLFCDVSQRCTTWIGRRSHSTDRPRGDRGDSSPRLFVTPLQRWRALFRPSLLETLDYTELGSSDIASRGVPKIGSALERDLLEALETAPGRADRDRPGTLCVLAHRAVAPGQARIGFSQAARNFVSVFRDDPPCLDCRTLAPITPSKIGSLYFASSEEAAAALAALSGDLFFWYWLARGDGFDVTSWLICDFLKAIGGLANAAVRQLAAIGRELEDRCSEALVFKKNAGRYVGNYNWRRLGSLPQQGDRLVLVGLGLGERVARGIADRVEQILEVNPFAGEKGIPAELHRPQGLLQ